MCNILEGQGLLNLKLSWIFHLAMLVKHGFWHATPSARNLRAISFFSTTANVKVSRLSSFASSQKSKLPHTALWWCSHEAGVRTATLDTGPPASSRRLPHWSAVCQSGGGALPQWCRGTHADWPSTVVLRDASCWHRRLAALHWAAGLIGEQFPWCEAQHWAMDACPAYFVLYVALPATGTCPGSKPLVAITGLCD